MSTGSQDQTIKLTENSRVKLYPLNSQPASRNKVFLGSREAQKFIIVDSIWEPLTYLSRDTNEVREIIKIFELISPGKFTKANAPTLVKLFILKLVEHGLVESIDGYNFPRSEAKSLNVPTNIPAWLKVLFSTPFIIIYLILASFAIVFPIMNNAFLPNYQDFFWSSSFSICLLTFFVFSWLTGLAHEMVHFLTAASRGVASKIDISHRLNFIVLETHYPNILSIPKKWRIATFLSGIVSDLILIAVIYLVFPLLEPLWAKGLAKQIILLEWLTIAWQFFFFMKTDIYFAIREAFGIQNLFTYSKQKLICLLTRKKFPFALAKKQNFIVSIYSIFLIFGTFVAILRYGFFYLPVAVKLFIGSLTSVSQAVTSGNPAKASDGIIVLIIQLLGVTLLLYTIAKEGRFDLRKIVANLL